MNLGVHRENKQNYFAYWIRHSKGMGKVTENKSMENLHHFPKKEEREGPIRKQTGVKINQIWPSLQGEPAFSFSQSILFS